MADDELTYPRAAARITRYMYVLAAAGALGAWAHWGWRAGAGFLFGALLSAVNFWVLRGMVNRLSGANPRRGSFLLALRYPLIAGFAYVILKFSRISVSAALAGIFVFTAAVFIEVAFEIAHARK
ncbi:MAG TPA: ATP synthase subunit I [Bryobacteraceae bacterium]|nr:ATP synthase subunit I [Bryobacteraceae bacterium]